MPWPWTVSVTRLKNMRIRLTDRVLLASELNKIVEDLKSQNETTIAAAVDRVSSFLDRASDKEIYQKFVDANEEKIRQLIFSTLEKDYSHSFVTEKSFRSFRIKNSYDKGAIDLWIKLDSKYTIRAKGSSIACYTDDITVSLKENQLKKIDPNFKL